MIVRFLGLTAIAGWLFAQAVPARIEWKFSVNDPKGRTIHGLKASDFRISEDGAERKIVAFEERRGEDGYVAVYSADAEDDRRFRNVRVDVVTDVNKRWRVRARPGYRLGER